MYLKQVTPRYQVWQSQQPTRDKSFIADIDLADHCHDFWYKCYDVLAFKTYDFRQKSFVHSILEFYDDWSYITWKQYDNIMWLRPHKNVRDNNKLYIRESMSLLHKRGNHVLCNFLHNTFNDHVLPVLDNDSLIYSYPTDRELERMWEDLTVDLYPDLDPDLYNGMRNMLHL